VYCSTLRLLHIGNRRTSLYCYGTCIHVGNHCTAFALRYGCSCRRHHGTACADCVPSCKELTLTLVLHPGACTAVRLWRLTFVWRLLCSVGLLCSWWCRGAWVGVAALCWMSAAGCCHTGLKSMHPVCWGLGASCVSGGVWSAAACVPSYTAALPHSLYAVGAALCVFFCASDRVVQAPRLLNC
jgi:hypothetical protein